MALRLGIDQIKHIKTPKILPRYHQISLLLILTLLFRYEMFFSTTTINTVLFTFCQISADCNYGFSVFQYNVVEIA